MVTSAERRDRGVGIDHADCVEVPNGSDGLRSERRSAFEVHFATGFLSEPCPPDALEALLSGRRSLVVTTPTVRSLYGGRLERLVRECGAEAALCVIPCTEASKSLDLAVRVCTRAHELRLDRTGVMVALGGGICSDIVTVAASLIRRGVAHVRVPTTLVGQVDAGIGIKGAVNFGGAKSFLGTFHPPAGVFIDSQVLATLPDDAFRDGIAEILKIALVADPSLFEVLASQTGGLLACRFQSPAAVRVVRRAVRAMLHELEQNPYEDRTYKRLVDFGHTFSPVLEADLGFRISHGSAVATDILLSAAVATELAALGDRDFQRICAVVEAARFQLPVEHLSVGLCRKALDDASRHRGGAVNLVLPSAIGTAMFVESASDLSDELLQRALQRMMLWQRSFRKVATR